MFQPGPARVSFLRRSIGGKTAPQAGWRPRLADRPKTGQKANPGVSIRIINYIEGCQIDGLFLAMSDRRKGKNP
jgi:hypothetical protein